MIGGKAGNIAVSLILAIYLMGVLISKTIVSSNILIFVFEGITVLDNYFFWMTLFSVVSIILSFRDSKKNNIIIILNIYININIKKILKSLVLR